MAGDHVAQLRTGRVAGCGQHHAQRAAAIPLGLHLVQPAVNAGLDELAQRRLETAEDGLRLGVAQPAVEFQRVQTAVLADHQARIQEARERRALVGHAADGGQDDLAQRARMDVGRDDRGGRIRAHAAGVGALVAVEQAFVVLAGGQCQHVAAISHHDEAGFLAGQEGLDHDARRVLAVLAAAGEVIAQELVDGRMGLGHCLGHHHALAGRQAVGLHHDGRALTADVVLGGCRVGEGLVGGRGDAVALHEGLGEVLGRFQLGRRLRGPEDGQPLLAEGIDNALGQRCLGTHHGERQILASGKQRQSLDVGDRQVADTGLQGRAGIAGGHVDRLEGVRAGQSQRDGVLASAATHHQASFPGCHVVHSSSMTALV